MPLPSFLQRFRSGAHSPVHQAPPLSPADIEAARVRARRRMIGMAVRLRSVKCDDGEELYFYTREALGEWVSSFPGRVFFHYGGRYDVFFLPRPSNIALSGSGILRAQIGRASVCDTWFLFQMSLAKIGKAVGLAKFDDKSNRIAELTDDEIAEHCMNDVAILHRALTQHQKWCLAKSHPAPRWQ